MNRRAKLLLLSFAAALALTLVVTVPMSADGETIPGTLLAEQGFGDITVGVVGPKVGDTVVWGGRVPNVTGGKAVEVLDITVSEGSPELRFMGARVYDTKYFDGRSIFSWQSKNESSHDPRRQPSSPLVGYRLSGEAPADRFITFEFLVCQPGDFAVRGFDVTYSDGAARYVQHMKVNYKADGAVAAGRSC